MSRPVKIFIDGIFPTNVEELPHRKMQKALDNLERYLKRDASRMLLGDMRDTVENWSGPPQFIAVYSEPYGTRMQLDVKPVGRNTLKWMWVSEGTPPRVITARTPKGMRFRPGYSPKTTPGGQYGGTGMRSGPWKRAMAVGPHSIEPRKFSVRIVDKRERQLRAEIALVVQRALR